MNHPYNFSGRQLHEIMKWKERVEVGPAEPCEADFPGRIKRRDDPVIETNAKN